MLFCFHFFVIVYCNSLLELYVGKVLSKLKRMYFYKKNNTGGTLYSCTTYTYVEHVLGKVFKTGKKNFE